MELTDIPRGLSGYQDSIRPRGPSALITKYQMLRQMQQNEVAASMHRRNSRILRSGIDPTVPKIKPFN